MTCLTESARRPARLLRQRAGGVGVVAVARQERDGGRDLLGLEPPPDRRRSERGRERRFVTAQLAGAVLELALNERRAAT